MKALVWLRWLQKRFEDVAPSLGAVLPPVGMLLLLIAAVFGAHSWQFSRGRIKRVATVTENVAGLAAGGGILYTPRLRFRTPNDEIVQVIGGPGADEIEFPAGVRLPVSYLPGDPQGAIIATVWRAYRGAILFGLLGTALFDLGWAIRVRARRRMTA